jgi:hypothetical protein
MAVCRRCLKELSEKEKNIAFDEVLAAVKEYCFPKLFEMAMADYKAQLLKEVQGIVRREVAELARRSHGDCANAGTCGCFRPFKSP